MSIESIIFDGIITKDTELYRYITLSQFITMVESQTTYLTKLTQWDDTWEAPTGKIPTQHESGKIEYPIYSYEEDLFGQCWSLDRESDALWRIYSPNKEGIVIKTTAQNFQLYKDIKFGVLAPIVYYKNLVETLIELNDSGQYRRYTGGFLKREEFKYEQEARLLVLNNEKLLGSKHEGTSHIKFEVDPFSFIEEIIIDPRASSWYVETIRNYCKRVGFAIFPQQSELYSDNVYEKTGLVQKWILKK